MEGQVVGVPSTRNVLVTGGCGFVGANLALALAARHPDWGLIALDNLKRRGSELNLARLRDAGVRFVHGDVREPDDLIGLEPCDAIVECSAEPSALAGDDGGTGYVVRTNLLGAYHCLEKARRDGAQMVFLSTSRVYPIERLNEVAYTEGETRFELAPDQLVDGVSPFGISERFPLEGARTLYGANKLAAELLIEEYAAAFGVETVINRCGVIGGPWQMGKVDQGVFAHWVLSHYFGRDLSYTGFGGLGKQVRDVVHVDDLIDLIDEQLTDRAGWAGVTVNVGGGPDSSLSLKETTAICRELTGRQVAIGSLRETRTGDIRIYVSDCRRLHARTAWRPRRGARRVLEDIFDWVHANDRSLRSVLA